MLFALVPLVSLFLSSLVAARPFVSRRMDLYGRADNKTQSDNNNKDVQDQNQNSSDVSFNNWGNFSQLDGFDNFYGSNNFGGGSNSQTIIIQDEQLVCSVQQIQVVQQQLVIIQEVAKQIILQSICDVEVQTIVIQQVNAGLAVFQQDVIRQSGNQAGFDKNIAGLVGSLVNQDGSINTKDFGFSGSSVGSNTVTVGGDNWNDATSPDSVKAALEAAQQAAGQSSD